MKLKEPPSGLRAAFPFKGATSRFDEHGTLSDAGLDLLERLLCYNPAHRISAAEALQHPW